MTRKEMVNLYYTNKKTAREDCDTMGLDRRRVQTMRYKEWNGIVETGFKTTVIIDNGSWEQRPVVARLRVKPELVQAHLEQLQHNDDETTS